MSYMVCKVLFVVLANYSLIRVDISLCCTSTCELLTSILFALEKSLPLLKQCLPVVRPKWGAAPQSVRYIVLSSADPLVFAGL